MNSNRSKFRILAFGIISGLFILATSFNNDPIAVEEQNEGWQQLFNGKDLNGWKQLNGTAEYKVENGCIVGVTKLNSPNSFLCTTETYDDFILEFDVFDDPSLNSGVQFRSESYESYQNGRVHGYQFEIDPSTRAFSGGIYDEARRGWLYPMSRNLKGSKAFKNGEWNHCRIEAIGPIIKTWINGVQCAILTDDMTSKGFFALQVHSIGDDTSLEGKRIMWKNIRIKTQNLDSEILETDPTVDQLSYLVNKLSDWEIRKGWRLLWDGQTSKGWRGAKLDHFPENGWEMNEGTLTITESGGGESIGPGDIITNKLFSSFDLELEFMITEGANSGIKYFVDAELNKGEGSAIGCEFQILDDVNHPDARMGIAGNRTVGSLYDLIAAENLSVPGREKQFKGIGTWNKARILADGDHVEHWLNNEKIVEYDRGSQMFRALVATSKYKVWPEFGQWLQGHILLQDHGNTVHFRSIKIKEL